MQKPSSRQQRGRSCTQSSIQWVLQRTNIANLLTVSSESSQKLNVRSRNSDKPRGQPAEDLRTGRQIPATATTPHTGQIKILIKIFLTEIIGTVISRDKTRVSMKSRIKMYSPYHFCPFPCHSLQALTYLVRSIMQLAEMQSHSLEIFAALNKNLKLMFTKS